jgi:LysM repeat protein
LIEYIVSAKIGGYYEVIKGDTLSRIAGKYGMSWQELYENNKDNIGDNPSAIEVGMILRVPPTGNPQVIIKEVIVEKEVIKEVIVEVEKPINAILNNGQIEVTVKSIVGVK